MGTTGKAGGTTRATKRAVSKGMGHHQNRKFVSGRVARRLERKKDAPVKTGIRP